MNQSCEPFLELPAHPFDQETLTREFYFARTLLQFTLSETVLFFTWSLSDVFIEESNPKGLFNETEKEKKLTQRLIMTFFRAKNGHSCMQI